MVSKQCLHGFINLRPPLRYLNKERTINKGFLTFAKATSLNAENLSNYSIKVLKDNGVHLTYIVSEGYDVPQL